jgi:hypothetical protein
VPNGREHFYIVDLIGMPQSALFPSLSVSIFVMKS